MPYVAPEVVQREKQIDLLTYVIQKSQNCHHLKEQYVFTDRKKYGKVVVETGSVKNFVALVKNGSFLVRITDMTILIEKEFIYGSSKRPNPTDYYRK